MATIEGLTERLEKLDKKDRYFTIEDIIGVIHLPAEAWFEELQRRHPLKSLDPAMVEGILSRRDEPMD